MKYVDTQNTSQDSSSPGHHAALDRKGHCKDRNADILRDTRRHDPVRGRLYHLHDYQTGLEPDVSSGSDRGRYHGHHDRDRHYRKPGRCSTDGNCQHLKLCRNKFCKFSKMY